MNQTQSSNEPKSCLDCPSLLSREDSTRFFGRNLSVPVCARYGKTMGTMNTDADSVANIAEAHAKNCASYGESAPLTPDYDVATFRVALPDPEALRTNIKDGRKSPENVNNCGICTHFVRQDIVATELGFPTGLCSIKGELVLGNRATYKARSCAEKSYGHVRTDVAGITMLPEYGVAPKSGDVKIETVDPTVYESDREVTPSEHEGGIRAWRKITNEDRFTYLPIYRRDIFSEAEQAKIPATGDDEHPEDYRDHGNYTYKIAVLWQELDETPGVWGEAGTGKTELFRYLAWLMQLPFERVSITGSTQIEDIAGSMRYDPQKGTYWQDGRLVSAWSKPCVLVLDEPNTGPPDVWQFVRPMTDNSKQLVVDQANDPTPRKRNDNCFLGLAMNPAWDPKNVGTHVVSDADVNRLMHISIPRPPTNVEVEILRKRCAHDDYEIPRATVDLIMSIAADIRAASDNDTLPITWATRPQIKVARATKWFDLKECYRMAVADFLEPEQQDQVLAIVDTHVPQSSKNKRRIGIDNNGVPF